MDDITGKQRETHSSSVAASPNPSMLDPRSRSKRKDGPPRTDIATVILHWVTAIAFIVSLFTGIRTAGDALHAPISKWLSPILPQGEIWTYHFFAGLTLFFCGTAYLFYMWRSGLTQRNALKKTRVLAMQAPRKLKWGAINVALHWFLYALVVFLTGTGVMLYLGHGNWWVYVHSTAAFVGLAYIFVHVVAHYFYGGWWQVFRVFRPARLVITMAVRSWSVLVGFLIGSGAIIGLASIDWTTRETLLIKRVSRAPDATRLLTDPAWAVTQPVFIRTQQGINLGGTGESLVEVRAVHDGGKVYFAFRWEDPSRSVRRLPLVKKADGWHHLGDNPYIDDVTTFYEDKFAVIFSSTAVFGAGGVAHFGPKPLAEYPGSRNGRGLHYTDGAMVDMWQWKPSRGGLLGHVDDMYIGVPEQPTPDQASQLARYQAGYWGDPGTAYYTYNFEALRPNEYKDGQAIHIKRLPRDLAATAKAMGSWDPNPDANVDDGSRWWMLESESVPYSAERDAEIPVGTIIPGVLISGDYTGDRADVAGSAHWADGYWILVTSRALKTDSKYDQDFVPGSDLYMWVSVFDHTQTRHTRHARPIRVVTQE
jgi:cytochrome b subunit of formate dehydrogenase